MVTHTLRESSARSAAAQMLRFWLLTAVLFQLALGGPPRRPRAKKASVQQLHGLKLLMNEESKRVVESQQSDGIDIFADVRRDPNSLPHPDELSINNPEEYFQGDVDLSERQVSLIAETMTGGGRKKRKIGKGPLYKLWDANHAISFDFAENIPAPTKAKIRDAMRLWQRNTCVRFEENGPSIDRLEFFDGGGCSSFVGRVGGTQGISIATPGCDAVGIISHEIGHSLGNFHEQARPDQDHNINVNYNNIPIGRWNNFNAVGYNQAEVYGLPYDTGSVMHYGPFGFATDPYIPTIRTIERTQQSTIGQRAGPSFLDYQAINLAYNCYDHCPPIDCQRGGYPHPNNCSICMCPDGLAGNQCDYIRESNQACGGVIEIDKEEITLTSPMHPDFFPRNTECFWLIKAPMNVKIYLEFHGEFDFICEDTCDKSYVEVKYHSDFRLTGARYCCSSLPRRRFQSDGNEMLVLMRGFGGAGKGFSAKLFTDNRDPNWNSITTATPPILTTPATIAPLWLITPPVETTSAPTAVTTIPTTPTTPAPIATTSLPKLFSLVPFTLPNVTPTLRPVSKKGKPKATTTIIPSFLTLLPPLTTPPKPEGNIPINECGCGEWSEWVGECTQVCGGCGHRERTRVCEKDSCRKMEKRPCNFKVCPQGTNFLINNGEFHILWRGCCVGLFLSGDECAALEAEQNPFLRIISSLLSASDQIKNNTITAEGGEHGRSMVLQRKSHFMDDGT